MKVCAIKSCPSGRKKKNGLLHDELEPVSFFQSRGARLKDWSKSLDIDLEPKHFICQLHFKKEDVKLYDIVKIGNTEFLSYLAKKKLKDNAIPTIEHQFMHKIEKNQRALPLIKVHQTDQQLKTQPTTKEQQGQTQHKTKDKQDINQQTKLQTLKRKQTGKEQREETKQPHQNEQWEQTQQLIKLVDAELPESEKIEPNLEFFKNVLRNCVLPPYWMYVEKLNELVFMRYDHKTKKIQHHIKVNKDLSVTAICSNNEEVRLVNKMSYDEINSYLLSVQKWPVCVGTQIGDFGCSKKCKGVIFGEDSYKHFQPHPRCKPCRVLRNRLQNRNRRVLSDADKVAKQRRNYRALTKRCIRLKRIIDKMKYQKEQLRNFLGVNKIKKRKINSNVITFINDMEINECDEFINDDETLGDTETMNYAEVVSSDDVITKNQDEAVFKDDEISIPDYEIIISDSEIAVCDDAYINNDEKEFDVNARICGDELLLDKEMVVDDDYEIVYEEEKENDENCHFSDTIDTFDARFLTDSGKRNFRKSHTTRTKKLKNESNKLKMSASQEFELTMDTDDHLKQNMRVVEKLLICEICGDVFENNLLLECHLSIHSG